MQTGTVIPPSYPFSPDAPPPPQKPDWNVGYTTREHLCLDLDNTSLWKAYNLVKLIMRQWPFTGDALILESSLRKLCERWAYQPLQRPYLTVARSSYHAVFNNFIPYSKSCEIIECLAELDAIDRGFTRIRQMRNDMTLRVSQTVMMDYVKPAPVPRGYVENPYCPEKGHGIWLYNRLRKTVQT